MSHASAAVRTDNGEIFHCEYNGTSDVMLPKLYKTYDEMRANWRTLDWPECKSNHSHIGATIASTYGGGFSWKGKVCLVCRVITDNHAPDNETEEEGLPSWYPK